MYRLIAADVGKIFKLYVCRLFYLLDLDLVPTSMIRYDTMRYDTRDDLRWKTDRQAASLI